MASTVASMVLARVSLKVVPKLITTMADLSGKLAKAVLVLDLTPISVAIKRAGVAVFTSSLN